MTRTHPTHTARRSLALACAVLFAVTALWFVRDDARADRRAQRRALAGCVHRDRPVGQCRRIAVGVRDAARHGPARARLDAEHEPHRLLRRLERRAGTTRPASTSRSCPYGDDHARGADGGRPGGVRDQLPGRADVRRRGRRADRLGHGDPPAHGPGDRGPRRRRTSPGRAQLDGKTYAGFGYPNEEPTLKSVIKARWRQGHVHDRDARHRGLRRAVREAGRLRDHVRRLGGDRGQGAGDRPADVPVRRLRLPGLLPGRARLRQPLAGGAPRPCPRLRRGDRPRVRALAASDPDEAARLLVSANPGVFDGSPDLPLASQRFLATGGYLRDANGEVGRQTLARVAGLLRLPVRPGAPGRSGRQAARRPRPTTARCSRTTSCREIEPHRHRRAGARRSLLVGLVRPRLGGLRADRGSRPDHAAAAVAGRRRPVGLPRGRGRPSRADPRRGDHRLRASRSCSPSPRPSPSIAGSRSGARSSRSW